MISGKPIRNPEQFLYPTSETGAVYCYRVLCEYANQSGFAHVAAHSQSEALQKCYALHGVVRATVIGTTNAAPDF